MKKSAPSHRPSNPGANGAAGEDGMTRRRFLGLPLVDKPIKRYPGVLDRIHYPNMSVYVGRGVGGGSLVNGGMAVVPRPKVFQEILPGIDGAEMFATYYPRATARLRAGTIPEAFLKNSEYYRYARVARDQAHRAGFKTVVVPNIYDYDHMQKEEKGQVPKSALGDSAAERPSRTISPTIPWAVA